MCMYVNPGDKVKVAEEDLTFYKVLTTRPEDEHPVYRTFYRNVPIEFGKTYEQEDKNFTVRNDEYKSMPHQRIDENAFHLFATYETALDFIRLNGFTCLNWKNTVCRAIVPKGTRYMEGVYPTYGCPHFIGANQKAVRTLMAEHPSIVTKAVRYEILIPNETVTEK